MLLSQPRHTQALRGQNWRGRLRRVHPRACIRCPAMRSRRLFLPFAAVLLTVGLAGCGGSSGSKLSEPLQDELSYFPSGSPLVLTVATDPNSDAIKHAQALEGQFPIAAFGQTALKNRLQQAGINYDNDVRPLFGNPLMLGATTGLVSRATSNQF